VLVEHKHHSIKEARVEWERRPVDARQVRLRIIAIGSHGDHTVPHNNLWRAFINTPKETSPGDR
jgi:hypothetical protein